MLTEKLQVLIFHLRVSYDIVPYNNIQISTPNLKTNFKPETS